MPRPHPPEFCQRAVGLARMREKPVAQITEDLGISDRMSRWFYGSPRVHAELRLGEGIRCSRKRVERLIAQAGVAGHLSTTRSWLNATRRQRTRR